MKRVIIFTMLLVIILSGCIKKEVTESEEIRNLANKNYESRLEVNKLTEERDLLQVEVYNLVENLRLSKLSADEIEVDISKLELEHIKRIGTKADFDDLFERATFKFEVSSQATYGEIVFKRIEKDGFDEYLSKLSKYNLSTIDNVTESVCRYLNVKSKDKNFIFGYDNSQNNEPVEYVLEEDYIMTRMRVLLKQ